jgi:parallel beta-helix repeat protein
MKVPLIAAALLLLPQLALGGTWVIQNDGSGDAPSIQAGIDSAAAGDTVRVLPGRYVENLDFKGKAIAVLGSGPEQTIIDGSGQPGACVVFRSGEDRGSVLCDFGITGGTGYTSGTGLILGGGIYVRESDPSILTNIIHDNAVEHYGGGIYCSCDSSFSSPLIQGNVIVSNQAGSNGGGIGVSGYVSPVIRDNLIADNWTERGDGGGIWLLVDVRAEVVEGNTIVRNRAGDHGGGIHLANPGSAVVTAEIRGNLIASNVAQWRSRVVSAGGGIWAYEVDALVLENTLVLNVGGPDSTWGGGIALDRIGASTIERNIIAMNTGGGIRCDRSESPTVRDNLAWQNPGGEGLGLCAGWTDSGGNVVADPYFCDEAGGIFTMAEDSPALSHPAGPLGAFPVAGCGPVPVVEVTTWGALKARFLSSPSGQ